MWLCRPPLKRSHRNVSARWAIEPSADSASRAYWKYSRPIFSPVIQHANRKPSMACFCQNTPKRMKTEKASIVFSLKANSSISKPPNYKINSRYRPMHLLDMCVRDVALWLGSDQSSPQAQLSNSKPVAQLLGHSLATLDVHRQTKHQTKANCI